jgi:hypothetical protein
VTAHQGASDDDFDAALPHHCWRITIQGSILPAITHKPLSDTTTLTNAAYNKILSLKGFLQVGTMQGLELTASGRSHMCVMQIGGAQWLWCHKAPYWYVTGCNHQ